MKRILSLFLLLVTPALAQLNTDESFDPFATENSGKQKTQASLISEQSIIAPGQPFTVAVKLVIPDKWHSYYINPGLIGEPLTLEWDLPKGFKHSNIQWPTPHIAKMLGMNTYGYSHTVYYPVTITPPATLETGKNITLKLKAKWQICDDNNCDFEPANGAFGHYSTSLKTGETSVTNESTAKDFIQARKHLPRPATNWKISAHDDGRNISLILTPPPGTPFKADQAYYYDRDKQTDAQQKQTLTQDNETYTLTIPRNKGNDIDPDPGPVLKHLNGILSLGDHRQSITISTPLDPPPAKTLQSANIGKLLPIVGGMLIGGLILNLMPCVFPVIGLKIMGFAQQAGEEKSKIVMHGVTFTAGVLISFWVLSGFLLSLRNTALKGQGDEVGWGYQLQNPHIVLTILLLMFILALNMFGLFEIGTTATGVGGKLQNRQGLSGSFFSGVLATVVATPCSAPFLGAAIGAAFALPNVQFMLAFTAMALGLALPYLVLSIFPHLIEKLPRPGPWMESFKQAMSFLLFATAGYLLWIYIAQTGLDFMFNAVVGLTLIAIGLWIYGRWNQPHRKTKVRTIAKILAILGLAGGVFATLPPTDKTITWEKWSPDKVEQLLDEDTPVYVDFTATWCLTCQSNKKTAYTQEIVQLFEEYGIVALKADKTKPNPLIEKKLQELGRTAIPVNVLYVPGEDKPIITPEILTPGYMKKLITENLEKPEK